MCETAGIQPIIMGVPPLGGATYNLANSIAIGNAVRDFMFARPAISADTSSLPDILAALESIQSQTDLIGSGSVQLSAPVSGDGDLLELILETDYLAANGRSLDWSFDEIPGITTAATGRFGLKDALTGTEVYVNTTGTVTDLGSGTFKVSFDITNSALNGLPPGKYDWSVEVLEGAYKITIARNRQIKTRVDVVEKQT